MNTDDKVNNILRVAKDTNVINRPNQLVIPNYSGVKTSAIKNYAGWKLNGSNIYYTDGKVGVGTTSPTSDITIKSSGDFSDINSFLQVEDSPGRSIVYGSVEMHRDDGNDDSSDVGINRFGYLGGTTKFRDFKVYNGKGTSVLMVDGSASSVGIGTTAPTHSLTLNSTSTGIALYNTADQTTNYERLLTQWSSNVALISAENGGTGTTRTLRLRSVAGGNATNLNIQRSGVPYIAFTTNTSSSTGNWFEMWSGVTSSSSSSTTNFSTINPTINQSGTAAYTILLINPTETATGSGAKNLIQAQVGSVDKFKVSNTGVVNLSNVINLKGYTVATLPAGTVGDLAYVTDALAPAFNVAVAGGGAVVVKVFYNGAAWVVG
jgi:hypothetical protein